MADVPCITEGALGHRKERQCKLAHRLATLTASGVQSRALSATVRDEVP